MATNKLLVAVKSCQRDRKLGFHDLIRGTWGAQLRDHGVQVKFFMGTTGTNAVKGHVQTNDTREALNLKSDETFVDSADSYEALPFKTRAICKWSIDRMFNHIFLCDNDTIIFSVKKFLDLPYEMNDYSGKMIQGAEGDTHYSPFHYTDRFGDYPQCYPWMSGGTGYFLSKPATHVIADTFPKVWAEDMYAGQALGPEIMKGNMFVGALDMKSCVLHFAKDSSCPEGRTVEMIQAEYNRQVDREMRRIRDRAR